MGMLICPVSEGVGCLFFGLFKACGFPFFWRGEALGVPEVYLSRGKTPGGENRVDFLAEVWVVVVVGGVFFPGRGCEKVD